MPHIADCKLSITLFLKLLFNAFLFFLMTIQKPFLRIRKNPGSVARVLGTSRKASEMRGVRVVLLSQYKQSYFDSVRVIASRQPTNFRPRSASAIFGRKRRSSRQLLAKSLGGG
jgi:hypothetical protein